MFINKETLKIESEEKRKFGERKLKLGETYYSFLVLLGTRSFILKQAQKF